MERRSVPSPLAALTAVIAFLLVANTALVLIVVPAADWFRLLPERLPKIQNKLAPLIDFYSQPPRFVDETVQKIGSAHVLTPVHNATLVCRLLLSNKKQKSK